MKRRKEEEDKYQTCRQRKKELYVVNYLNGEVLLVVS